MFLPTARVFPDSRQFSVSSPSDSQQRMDHHSPKRVHRIAKEAHLVSPLSGFLQSHSNIFLPNAWGVWIARLDKNQISISCRLWVKMSILQNVGVHSFFWVGDYIIYIYYIIYYIYIYYIYIYLFIYLFIYLLYDAMLGIPHANPNACGDHRPKVVACCRHSPPLHFACWP